MEDVFKEINDRVNVRQIIEYYHEPLNHYKKVRCPLHNDKTPSLSVKEKENMFKCFSAGCDFGGDGIKFLAGLKKIDNLEAAKMINEDFHLGISFENKELNDNQRSIRDYILACQKDIDKTDYLQKRGLTIDTLRHFGVGYDVKKKMVVIPYSSTATYYQARNVITKSFYKPETSIAGEEPIWNENALRKPTTRPIIIVESPICAMSIMQYGGLAIALCGVGKYEKIVDIYKKAKNTATLVLCLDNDDAGAAATEKLKDVLRSSKIKFIQYNLAGECKDPNELLQKKADRLCEGIYQITLNCKTKSMDTNSTEVLTGRELSKLKLPPIRWVVEGLIPEGLSIMVAASKVGKSWMMMDLIHSITEDTTFLGKPTKHSKVLYYALEDNERRLIDRSQKIWRGKEMNDDALFRIRAKTLDTGLIDDLEQIIQKYKGIKLIIFDTFQKIRGAMQKNESTYAYDYREMSILKNFADRYDVSIILVHHTRKMLDENDVFNMTSGSTAIMGASDTAFLIYKKKRNDEDATLCTVGRDVYLDDMVITRDMEQGGWIVVESPEKKEKLKRDAEFNNNPITKTLLELLSKQPSGWSGTVRQLTHECYDFLHVPIGDTESAIGKMLSSSDFENRIFMATRCEHTFKRRSNGVVHTFAPKQRTFLTNNDYKHY